MYRIWRARQQAELQLRLVLLILERRLEQARRRQQPATSFAPILERLIEAVEGRHPSVADVARDVRYRMFERPAYLRTRERAYAEAAAHLDLLRADPAGAERERRIAALVACPQPLFGLLAGRFEGESPQLQQLMLEVMVRRYYRIHRIEPLRALALDGRVAASTRYETAGRQVLLLAATCPPAELARAVRELAPLVDAADAGCDVALDLYAWREGPLGDPDENARRAQEALAAAGCARTLRRAVFVLSGPEAGWGAGGAQHFTFRDAQGRYEEQRLYRGIHP